MNKKDSPVDGEKNEWFCGKKRRVVLGAGRRVMSNEKGWVAERAHGEWGHNAKEMAGIAIS